MSLSVLYARLSIRPLGDINKHMHPLLFLSDLSSLHLCKLIYSRLVRFLASEATLDISPIFPLTLADLNIAEFAVAACG